MSYGMCRRVVVLCLEGCGQCLVLFAWIVVGVVVGVVVVLCMCCGVVGRVRCHVCAFSSCLLCAVSSSLRAVVSRRGCRRSTGFVSVSGVVVVVA